MAESKGKSSIGKLMDILSGQITEGKEALQEVESELERLYPADAETSDAYRELHSRKRKILARIKQAASLLKAITQDILVTDEGDFIDIGIPDCPATVLIIQADCTYRIAPIKKEQDA